MTYMKMRRSSEPVWLRGVSYNVDIANAAVKCHLDNKPAGGESYLKWYAELQEIVGSFSDAWDQYQNAPVKKDAFYARSIALSKFRAFLETTTLWEQFDSIYPVIYWGGSHVVGMKGDDAYLVCSVSQKWIITKIDDPEEATIIPAYQNKQLGH